MSPNFEMEPDGSFGISDLAQGFIALLAPDGTLLDVSRGALEFIDAHLRDVVGTPFWDTPWWHHTETSQDALRAAVEKGASGKPARFEAAHQDKSGKVIPVDVSLTPLFDTDGTVISMVSEARDITELKEVSKALEESELRLRLACDLAEIGTWSWNLDNDELYWDERQFALFGIPYASGPTAGKDAIARIHPDDQARIKEAIRTAIRSQKPLREEFRVMLDGGGVRWLFASGDVVRDERAPSTTMIGVNFDITEQKLAEAQMRQSNLDLEARVAERTKQLEDEMQAHQTAQEELAHAQRLEAVGQLAGGVAHDFNNLLAVIGGNLELAEMRSNDPRIADLIHDALDAVEAGASLNQRLLSFARKRPLVPTRISVNDRIENARHLLERSLDENIDFETALSPDIWDVFADAGEFDSAILNLAVNARDAMPNGGTLTIATKNQSFDADNPQAGDYVSVVVNDTGMGMSPEVLEKAFTPFFTTKEAGKGSGLGLSSVFGFAKQSGGFVTLESTEGKGTSVTLLLPKVGQPEAQDPLTQSHDEMPKGQGELIMLVEDDPKVRDVTSELLVAIGFYVVEVATADEAIGLLKRPNDVALIFSDVRMPGKLSGYDLAKWAYANRPGMKVVLTSGYHAPDAKDQLGKLAQTIKLLPKPYTSKTLAETLTNALKT